MLKRWCRVSATRTGGHRRPIVRYATHWTRFSSTISTPTQPTAPSSPPKESRMRSVSRGIIWTTAIFLTVHIFIDYVLDYGACHGVSMVPTLNASGDAVLISKYYRRGRGVKVGDVISYAHPINPGERALKRVVGLEGDFVLRDTPKRWWVEGEDGDEKMIQVPEGHIWITGDNLKHSRDSRMFGPLPMALIKGKAIRRFSPWWNFLGTIKFEGLSESELDDGLD